MSIELSPKQLKRLERALKIETGGLGALLENLDELEDKIDDLTAKPEIKGDKGEKGDTGERGFDGKKGEKGDKGDKGDTVIVEKVIEKTEVIKEVTPEVDTNEIIEEVISKIPPVKEKPDMEGKEIVKKINDLPLTPDEMIDAKHIKNMPMTMFAGGGTTPSPIDPNLFIQPTVSLSGGGSYEKGQTIEDVDLSWVCNKTMATRNLSSPVPEADRLRGEGQNGSYTHTGANISTNTTYSITVSDTINSATATTSLSFKLMFYWGISDETSLNNAQVLALNKELKTASEEIEFPIDAEGQYIYFLYPTEWGAKDVYVNGFVMTDWELSVVPITNPFGNVTNYNMVRSTIKQNGDNIIITLKQYGE